MRFPEATERGHAGFTNWYERVIRLFFDEVHTLEEARITGPGPQPEAKVLVNWQAKVWNPPEPKEQVARLRRLPDLGRPAVARERPAAGRDLRRRRAARHAGLGPDLAAGTGRPRGDMGEVR
jgi:hypothetical protein